MSHHDLVAGGRWSQQLAFELEDAHFGLICLTPDNRESPWLLFEAGALTKHLSGRACCILLGGLRPADVGGPLGQFQHAYFTHDEVRKLLYDINALLEHPLEATSLDLIFEKWWPDLHRDIANSLADPALAQTTPTRRSADEILEELLARVRAIERQLEGASLNQPLIALPIQQILLSLPRSQSAVLGSLISLAGNSIPTRRDILEARHSKPPIDALLELGVITMSDTGSVAIQDALVPIVSQHFRLNPDASHMYAPSDLSATAG